VHSGWLFVLSDFNVEELIMKNHISSKRNFCLKKDYNNEKEKKILFVSEGFVLDKQLLIEYGGKINNKKEIIQDNFIFVRGVVRHAFNKERILRLYEKGTNNKPWYEAYYCNNKKIK